MEKFKTLKGVEIPDVIEYIREYISTREDIEILIGSDSQCYGHKKTVYGIVIALYTKGKGAHVLCTRETVPMERVLSTRLINEVWKAIEVAEYLTKNGIPKPKWIDIDISPDPKYKSNIVLRQAIGLIEGLGYSARYKHFGAMMTYAANNLVKM